jgi:hypothetical protein
MSQGMLRPSNSQTSMIFKEASPRSAGVIASEVPTELGEFDDRAGRSKPDWGRIASGDPTWAIGYC